MSSEKYNIADYKEILKAFPTFAQEAWKDNPDVMCYLMDISSVGLQQLNQEPERLAEEKSTILEQTQDLAFRNYKTFIQTAECSQKIFQDFNIVEKRLECLLNKLPEFSEKCQEFGKETKQLNTRWKQISLTLNKHPQLLEFLELPQLMDTYVRNAYYEEALELTSYIRKLERKHKNIPLIVSIVDDIKITLRIMLSQLLMQLRSNIQLPACLKVVGYLRRMDVFSEAELRIKFLQARDSWFQIILNDIPKQDAYQHVIKVIENSRTHLFDIITQYRALFSDDDPLLVTSAKDTDINESAIFHSWISQKVSQFIQILEQDLALGLEDRIDSVLAQCMYFGLSFSRVGIDFRPLLIPVFKNSVLSKFSASVQSASIKFEEAMQSYTIINFSVTTTNFNLSSVVSNDNLQPPNSLLDFYPLAQYCNDILGAFNGLKFCAFLCIAPDVTSLIETSLIHVTRVIADYEMTEKDRMNKKELDLFSNFCFQYANELIPHFEKCLLSLFPHADLANILGVSSLEFNKLNEFCSLNINLILKPLEHILPVKEEDDNEDLGITITCSVSETDDNAKNTIEIS